jgi:short-subunit dehydrogenase
MKLKKINQQTIVITGATSGIGLTTARMAAHQGANVVLVARNEEALIQLVYEIQLDGGHAVYAVADVADENALHRAAEKAQSEFGGFDTWINNAGVAIYGKITDVSDEDSRRVFETNFWGVVNGSRIAVEYLREKGGAIINLGSEVSDMTVPLIGMYSASKHAVKGFTDSLRMEVEADGLPISVTLIKPTAIHTPFTENAKNYLPFEPQLPAPVYAPDLVAEAILHCAQNPKRDFFVGEMAAIHSALATYAPRLTDKFMEMSAESMQNSGRSADPNRPDGLYETNSDLRERGSDERYVLEKSLYQRTKIHPVLSGALAVGAGIGVAALITTLKAKSDSKSKVELGSLNVSSFDIHQGMNVFGADGLSIGTIDQVENEQIRLSCDDGTKGNYQVISTKEIESIDGNTVFLLRTGQEICGSQEIAKKDSPTTKEENEHSPSSLQTGVIDF